MPKHIFLESLPKLFPPNHFKLLKSLEALLFKSILSLESKNLHDFLPEKPFITPALSQQFELYRQEFYRIFSEICNEMARKTQEYDKLISETRGFEDLKLKLEIEKSKNELFEKTQEISQKEAENMRTKLIDLANRLDKEAESLSTRRKDFDGEVDQRAQSKILEIQSFYQEKEKKLLETITATDEKAAKQEEIVKSLEKRLNDVIVKSRDTSTNVTSQSSQEETKKTIATLEKKVILAEKSNLELQKTLDEAKNTVDRVEKENKELIKNMETVKFERKRLSMEKKTLTERLLEVSETLDQKTQIIETFQNEHETRIMEVQREFMAERDELLGRLRKLEKNELLIRKAPSQSQGFSPLPKDFEVKFENLNDFRLDPFTMTPKNRPSTHTKVNDRSFSIDFRKEKTIDFEYLLVDEKKTKITAENGKDGNAMNFEKISLENNALKEELKRFIEETCFLKKSLESLKEAKGEIQRQFEKVLRDANKIREENGLKDRRILGLVKEIESLSSLKQERSVLLSKIEENEKEFSKLKDFLKDTIDENKKKILELQAEFSKEREILSIKHLEQIKEKESQITELTSNIKENSKKLEESQSQLKFFHEELTKSQTTVSQTQAKVVDLTRQLETLKKNQDLKKLKDFYEQVLREKDQFIIQEREKVQDSLSKLKELNQMNEDLMRKLNERNDKIKDYEAFMRANDEVLGSLKEKLIWEEKHRMSTNQLQKEIGEKNKEILRKNGELASLHEKIKQLSLNLEEERRKAFNKNGTGAIFIDDPNVKDLEIAGLKQSLRQKQLEIDRMKEKIEKCLLQHYNFKETQNSTPKNQENINKTKENQIKLSENHCKSGESNKILETQAKTPENSNKNGQPVLLLKALEKKDAEIKALTAKNAEIFLNLQTAYNKLGEFQQKASTNNNIPRGKSDGLVFDRTFQRLLSENERMKAEISKLEHLLMKSRLDTVEERSCLQNEMKILEEKNVEFKIKLAQTAFDKDYYMIKYQGFVKDQERNKK